MINIPLARLCKTLVVCIAPVAFSVLSASDAIAHDSRPIFVQIDLREDGQTLVSWMVPDSVNPVDAPLVELSGGCVAAPDPDRQGRSVRNFPTSGSLRGMRWYACESTGAEQSILLNFPGIAPSLATLVRVQRKDGSSQTVLGAPGVREIVIPARESTSGVFQHYALLGIEHILTGYDHLLFVACVVLLAGTFRRTALAVTGFTAAHSITLGAAAMGYVSLPVPPVEAAIALSIVFLATELARERRDTLTWRHPILVAGLFGLLHGFGFAAVLSEIGLPDHESLVALLAFNLGVETGQLGFVAVLMLGFALIGRFSGGSARMVFMTRAAAYLIGGLATFWLMERLVQFA